MKKICMKSITLFGLALLTMASVACLDPETADPDEAGDLEIRENLPFHVAVFDHVPTEDEVHADLARFLATTSGEDGLSMLVSPTGFILPQRGQKLVRIDATTSNISDAGTDAAKKVRFTGVWQAGSLQQFAESFVLDNPNVDDLDRNTVSIFYYLLNVGQYVPGLTQDRFVEGQISNTGSNAWHCNNIALVERNYTGITRSQSLPFNQWVEYPSRTTSSWLVGNNNAWLTYY